MLSQPTLLRDNLPSNKAASLTFIFSTAKTLLQETLEVPVIHSLGSSVTRPSTTQKRITLMMSQTPTSTKSSLSKQPSQVLQTSSLISWITMICLVTISSVVPILTWRTDISLINTSLFQTSQLKQDHSCIHHHLKLKAL